MDVQVEKVGPCEAKVRFTVASSELEAEFQAGLKEAAQHVRIKGFRPGKVPAAIVEKKVGDAVRKETAERFLRKAYQKAVEDEQLTPAAHPRVRPEDLAIAKGQDLTHEFQLSLKPQFELGNYKGLEVEGHKIELEEGEVARAIEELRDQHAQPQALGEDGVPGPQGLALAKVSFSKDDEVVAEREAVRLTSGRAPKGIDEAAWRQALEVATAGAEFELPIEFPPDYPREDLRGQSGMAKVSVSQVFELIRPTEDELCQAFGVEDRAGLEQRFADEILKHKTRAEEQRVETALIEQVIAAHQMPLPEPMLVAQIEARRAQAKNQLLETGVSEQQADAQIELEAEGTRQAAENSLRALFLIERIGDAEDLRIGQQDLVAELRLIAQRNQVAFEDARKYYEEHGLFEQLAVELLERKVRKMLRSEAKISTP